MAGLLLHGARVLTMDPLRPRAWAVAVRDGRIAAVGSEEHARAALDGEADELDLGGGALLPGFVDAHHHACMAAFATTGARIELPEGAGIDDLLEVVATEAAAHPDAPWVRLQGYDHHKLREQRAPRREELDEAVGDRPALVIAYSYHEGALNSRGLEEMGWHAGTPDPPNGLIVRDGAGRPAGEVAEQAMYLCEARSRGALLPTAQDAWLAEIEAHGRRLLAAGITRIGDAAVPPDFEALYERAAREGRLPLTVHRMPVAAVSQLDLRIDGPATGEGPGVVPVGAAKLFMDGADRCAMCLSGPQVARTMAATLRRVATGEGLAALRFASQLSFRPHLGPDHKLHQGMLFWDRAALRDAVARAGAAGFQVAQHAIGNEAVDVAVDALEHVGAALDARPGRPRLEHLSVLDEPLARRIADAGAIGVVQPGWVEDLGEAFRRLGVPAPLKALPLATLRRAGVTLAGSSDFPVSGFDVLTAVRGAVRRTTSGGHALHPEEGLHPVEALEAYTIGGAQALGAASEAGTIEAGKRADLVHLSQDPVAIDAARLDEVEVRRTWVAGRLAHPPPA